MSHSAHFLSRLSRLENANELDVALKVYRDTKIVTEVIQREAPRAERGRVALALNDSPRSPHLVVTLEGAFITCLGPGMSTTDLPVVSRGELSAVIERRRRERFADELIGIKGQGHQIVHRLNESATLSREEFVAVSAYQPRLRPNLHDLLLLNLQALSAARRASEVSRGGHQYVERFWALNQCFGILSTLLGLSANEVLKQPALTEKFGLSDFMIETAWWYGMLPTCARALWASAKTGAPRLERLAHRLSQDPPDAGQGGSAYFELAAIGVAHPALFDEAQGLLRQQEAKGGEVVRQLIASMNEPTALEEPALQLSRPANIWSASLLIRAVPFIATCEAEALFAPHAQLVARDHRRFNLAATRRSFAAQRNLMPKPAPITRQNARVSRNERCACNSGKKHKRCCGAERITRPTAAPA